MYGIFFEEINQAGDGGLYAELLRGRGIEDPKATGWKGDFSIVDADLNPARTRALRIVRTGDSPAVASNEGFWGIPLKRGARYRLVVWAKGDVPLDATLEGSGAKPLASARLNANGGWRRFEQVVRPSDTETKARLVLSPAAKGEVSVAYASLMPLDTWRRHGLRPDLARHVADMRPGFVRFPGGCYVEGGDRFEDAFDWKRSVEPVESRKGLAHSMWGYANTFGLGYHEYLQWCEDLGAEPLFVVNCGINHRQTTPMNEMSKWVDDALDAIEYANGPVTTKWGALRARNGHPKPFGLKYIEIGNENGGWFFGGNAAYEPRYRLIYDAIKRAHKEIVTIADWPIDQPKEIVDEHYYQSPAWFWQNADRYDRYDRKGPKVYVGEYAVTRGAGTGNLDAALGEAAFMTGIERNADVVRMASYAPLFVNVNNRQWNPNAIVFDNHQSYGTPSYWVQALFAQNRPDRVLSYQVDAPASESRPPVGGRVGLQTWRSQVEFKDVTVEADGKPVFDASGLAREGLEIRNGQWTVENGVIRETSRREGPTAFFRGLDVPNANRVTLRLKARKIAGDEGFIVMFSSRPGHELQWNVGGWDNTLTAFQRDGERMGDPKRLKVETGRWYDVRIEHEPGHVRAYLDGNLVEDLKEPATRDFVAVAGEDLAKREIVVKIVNGAETPRLARIDLRGATVGASGRAITLTNPSLSAENSFEDPRRISPNERRFALSGPSFDTTVPGHSLVILRIPRK